MTGRVSSLSTVREMMRLFLAFLSVASSLPDWSMVWMMLEATTLNNKTICCRNKEIHIPVFWVSLSSWVRVTGLWSRWPGWCPPGCSHPRASPPCPGSRSTRSTCPPRTACHRPGGSGPRGSLSLSLAENFSVLLSKLDCFKTFSLSNKVPTFTLSLCFLVMSSDKCNPVPFNSPDRA